MRIFPEYDIVEGYNVIELRSYVRKQMTSNDERNNTYYLIPVVQSFDYDLKAKNFELNQIKEKATKRFIIECYKCSLFYIVNEDVVDAKTIKSMVEKDPNQESEYKRLTGRE